jgi:hypothetical protein
LTEQLDYVKDTSIAVLSTSALLLTLVLAFISPAAPRLMGNYLLLATFGLYVSCAFNAMLLSIIGAVGKILVQSERWLNFVRVVLAIMFASFMLGLFGIILAVTALMEAT